MQRLLFILALLVLGKAGAGTRGAAQYAGTSQAAYARRQMQNPNISFPEAHRRIRARLTSADRARVNRRRRGAGLGALPRRPRRRR